MEVEDIDIETQSDESQELSDESDSNDDYWI